MKYSITISTLLLLSSFFVLLLLYFGKLSRQIEKDNDILISQIKDIKSSIKINELEYTAHTNTNYLLKLRSIYLIDNSKNEPAFNYISLNDFKKQNIQKVIRVNIN